MHDEPLSPQQAAAAPDPLAMHQTVQTQSYKALLYYAVPYALGYVFIASLLTKLGVPITGLALSLFIVVVLHTMVIGVFSRQHGRYLEPLERHRLGLLIALLVLLMTSMLMLWSLYEWPLTQITMAQLVADGVIAMLVISGAIGLFINYVVVRFGLGWLQYLWSKLSSKR
ncbi:hypothetical protein [Psychrobacter lutiphocae]|uniref:hypothetical protein n=1 Tax=Psychrobacter lutiphocae TaxID=540500 RepID=UPI000369502D|nr:hypothetical protein [Psychrobacter lutiphocae]